MHSMLEKARTRGEPLLYVASRASEPDRPAMWRQLRDERGWCIVSSWIDEAGDGQTASFQELWARIDAEIRLADGLMLYAQAEDFPLKGALVEVGMALARGKPVAVVLGRGLQLEPRSRRPLGSWAEHPLCSLHGTLDDAYQQLALASRDARAALLTRRVFERIENI